MELDTLITLFQKKDLLAFEKLYEMYSKNICGVINAIVRDTTLAEEICQDVFLKIWNQADSYDPEKGRFFTWILNIARNAAIDEVRSKSYKQAKQNLPADYFVGILENKDQLNLKVDTIGLRSLLKNLKDQCKQLLELLYFKGYTQKEAAETLDIPLGTVKTRNRSCISQLRKNMP